MSTISRKHLRTILDRLDLSGLEEDRKHAFLVRLGENFDTMYTHLHRLYGSTPDFDQCLREIVETLLLRAIERPGAYAVKDRERELDPHWFLHERWVGYMCYVDRFAGNLHGFRERIGYLKRLGVNYVHVMPLAQTPESENDGGYAVSDYRAINPGYGSMEDLRGVVDALHTEDMILCLDIVLNHTSDEHEWAKKALNGDSVYQDYYLMFPDRSVPDEFEKHMPEVFPETAPGNFTYRAEINRWVLTVFNTYQWDLNYANPKVFAEILDIVLYWANQGIDVLRLDAVPYLWKRIGTECRNEPEAHYILRCLKACARVVAPGLVFKSEAIVEHSELVKYLGDGNTRECDIGYNATLMAHLWDALATKDVRLLKSSIIQTFAIPEGTTWINYVRCHDDIGLSLTDDEIHGAGFHPGMHRRFLVDYLTGIFTGSPARGLVFMHNPKTGDARISGSCASLCGLERALEIVKPRDRDAAVEFAVRRILLLYGVVFSIGGIPLIYYGDEVGFLNDYSFREDPATKADNRWVHRPIFDWKEMSQMEKTGGYRLWIQAAISGMSEVRKRLPEFDGEVKPYVVHMGHDGVLGYIRSTARGRTFVLSNFSEDTVVLDSGLLTRAGFGERFTDRLTGKQIKSKDGAITVPPLECLWLAPADR